MKLSEFNFNLPEELIASHPLDNRDDARMLVLHRKSGEIEHLTFKEILNFFNAEDPAESFLTINAVDGTVIDRGFGY